MDDLLDKAVARIRQLADGQVPAFALILGSGFEEVLRSVKITAALAYQRLPGFPVPQVPGHRGELFLAELADLPLLVCCGRAHYYEGAPMEKVTFPTRALTAAGVKKLILTNAAGGINPKFSPGEFMLFSDHINFMGVNPLRGLPVAGGRCFVPLTEAYSRGLGKRLKAAARKAKVRLHEGVYLAVSGPTYETPAEIRAFRRLGADAVGMSTVPEVLMARYGGMEVAALSCITNRAAGMSAEQLSHDEVLAVGRQSARDAARLLETFAREMLKSGIDGKNV